MLCYIDWCLHADNVCTPNAVREHPDKERFRSLNLESKAFHSRVGRYVVLPCRAVHTATLVPEAPPLHPALPLTRHALAVRFLEACGFQHDGTRLVLTAAAARGLPFTALENALNATTVWAEVRGGRGSFVDPAGQRKAAPPALLQGDEAKDGGGGGANSASTDDETALRRLRCVPRASRMATVPRSVVVPVPCMACVVCSTALTFQLAHNTPRILLAT